MKKLRLKLTTREKINLLKYGHVKIQRGIFTIIITLDVYGECEINILNPYDIEKFKEELLSFAFHLEENEN